MATRRNRNARPTKAEKEKFIKPKPEIDDTNTGDDGLTDKERLFYLNYIGQANFNGTEAAKLAGYKGTRVTLGSVAYDKLRKPQIAELVKKHLAAAAMSANEVLALLGAQARNEAAPYLVVREGVPGVDLEAIIRDGKQALIKGITYTRTGKPVVEFYDAQAALVQIGRHHKLFSDQLEVKDERYDKYMTELEQFMKNQSAPPAQDEPQGGSSNETE